MLNVKKSYSITNLFSINVFKGYFINIINY
jgi:hypothetical protein